MLDVSFKYLGPNLNITIRLAKNFCAVFRISSLVAHFAVSYTQNVKLFQTLLSLFNIFQVSFVNKKLTLFVYVTNLAITWLVFFSFFSVLADAYFYFDNNFEFICHKFQNLFAIVIVIVIFIFLYIMFKNVFFLCCSCFTYFSQPGLSRGRNPIRIYLTDFSNL